MANELPSMATDSAGAAPTISSIVGATSAIDATTGSVIPACQRHHTRSAAYVTVLAEAKAKRQGQGRGQPGFALSLRYAHPDMCAVSSAARTGPRGVGGGGHPM